MMREGYLAGIIGKADGLVGLGVCLIFCLTKQKSGRQEIVQEARMNIS